MDVSWLTDGSVLGNSADRWLLALAAFVAVFVVLRLLRSWLQSRIAVVVGRTEFAWDDLLLELLGHTGTLFLVAISLWASTLALDLEATTRLWFGRLLFLTLLLQSVAWGNRALMFSIDRLRSQEDIDSARRTTLAAVLFLGRLALYSLILLLALANFGIDITALVASLGIASLAVGLALQGVLSDLFASLSIVMDKPFEIGDFIIVEDFLGSVEHIGLRTTRIRSLSGEQLVFTNDDLLGSRIRNFKRMQERRVVFGFGVEYATPKDQLAKIPGFVQETIESLEHTRFDRSHFKGFGAYSLDFETVFYVLTPDYNQYMDLQQTVNLAIVERFEREGIAFAFPSNTVFLHAKSGFGGWGASAQDSSDS